MNVLLLYEMNSAIKTYTKKQYDAPILDAVCQEIVNFLILYPSSKSFLLEQ